jgi:integrase
MASGHIRQRSRSSWEIRWRDGGKTRTATIVGGKRAAEQALRAALTAVDRGESVQPAKLTVTAQVQARIAQWQASGKISARTAETYQTLAVEIANQLGPVPLQKLSTLHIESWHVDMARRGLGRTPRAAHELLARSLADAVKHRLLSRNFARDQGPPAVKKAAQMPTLTADQTQELLVKLVGDPWRVPVIVGLYCGLRRSEQLALRWNRINLDARKMEIVEALNETRAAGVTVGPLKTDASRRTISLPAIVTDILRDHRRTQLERCLQLGSGRPASDSLVFPGDDGGYDAPNAFSCRWARAATRLGIPQIRWHSLRHTHASMLIAAGVDVVTVSRRLGHANPAITLKVYSHMFATSDAAAAAAIDKALGQ